MKKNSSSIPYSETNFNKEGEQLYNNGDIEGAIQSFLKAIEADNNQYEAYNNIGVCYWMIGKKHEALEQFALALKKNPSIKPAFHNALNALSALNKTNDALLLCQDYLHLHQNDDDLVRLAAEILFDTKELISQKKHIKRWRDSFHSDYMIKKRIPWITFDAINYLEQTITPGMKIFEWGSGGSTLFWLTKGADYLVSIEHDKEWYDKMKLLLTSSPSIDYRLALPIAQPSNNRERDPANPHNYSTNAPDLSEFIFNDYVTQIDEYPDSFFDAIMIDGRSRPPCIVHGVRKVKIGGIIVLDDADRPYYLSQTLKYLTNFERHEFYGLAPAMINLSQTNIYKRMI